jgi:hypothetical protein
MYHIQVTIFDEKNNAMLCDVLASCTSLANVPRTLATLLKTEPVTSVTNGSPHAPITLPVDASATPQAKHKSAAATQRTRDKIINLARRNFTYIDPTSHMEDHPLLLRKHGELVGYINAMPKDIPGIDDLRQQAHRKWFAWYDRGISPGVFDDWLGKAGLTVRTWLAEYLMARFAAHDFAGRTLRMEVQRYRASLLSSRISPVLFDSKMRTYQARLDRLQAPVTKAN